MTGQTILPMPIGMERLYSSEQLTNDEIDIELKKNIEEMMAKWALLINDIVDENIARTFCNENQPLPSAGILLK